MILLKTELGANISIKNLTYLNNLYVSLKQKRCKILHLFLKNLLLRVRIRVTISFFNYLPLTASFWASAFIFSLAYIANSTRLFLAILSGVSFGNFG